MLDPLSTRRVPDTPLAPPTRTAEPLAEPADGGRSAAGTTAGSRLRMTLAMLGPAFVVSVAYVDPGNFATNMTAGTRYGPMLLWVIAAANVMAVFVQYLACKAGVATGRDLPQLCRAHTPRPLNRTLWLQAELVAMATDLAEFVGGAVALHILFGIPLLPAAFIVAATSLLLLTLAPEGRRRFEIVTAALLLVILAGFVYQAAAAGAWSGALSGMRPRFADTQSILLATGMIGATVMPHVIYLHSSLARSPARSSWERKRRQLRAHRSALFIALGIAGLVNASMLTIAAAALHGTGTQETLEAFHTGLGTVLGPGAAFAFALALLASGLASSGVGTFAGQVILRGFLGRRIPLTVRRLVTMAPPLVVLSLGVEPTQALVLSQVVLSFGVPFALVPLLVFTARRRIMGDLVNRRVTTVAAVVVSTVISVLNVLLLVRTFAG
ncbi:divalent metal cation transporter MntH [Streptomyces sp. NWU49]|uniref:Nramp family divalent metal transporter n=1 Tax=Streptomyces TaxID=1883 RepID=UPI0001AEF1E4|nr:MULTISPECIES: Nramp family divalent metal transporter [Streptomyces]PWJ05444.1 divalent metal cation transporter MntH [Streptomyces sp. NWU49]